MKNLGWILLAFILGLLLTGCVGYDRMIVVVRAVQSDVEIEAQYEIYQGQRERKQAD